MAVLLVVVVVVWGYDPPFGLVVGYTPPMYYFVLGRTEMIY